MKKFFPRLMWADVDSGSPNVPVAIYNTRADQRANRPDLKPIRVIVRLAKKRRAS